MPSSPERSADQAFQIEQALRAHPDVDDVRVCEVDGHRVAAVAPRGFASATELREYAFQRLGAPADDLGVTLVETTGDIDVEALAVRLAGRPQDLSRFRGPASATERWLCERLAARLRVVRVGAEDDLFDLGVDSHDAIALLAEISERFAVDLPLEALYRSPTLRALAAELSARAADPRG
jgi:acyl carrier protein